MNDPTGRVTMAVAVCTYKRNHDLGVLLLALLACAERIRDRAAVGVAITDDTAAGEARGVAESAADWFSRASSMGNLRFAHR